MKTPWLDSRGLGVRDAWSVVVTTVALLIYGVLQERVMTRSWGSGNNKELFPHSAFLVLSNRLLTVAVLLAHSTICRHSIVPAAPIKAYCMVSASNMISTLCQYEALKYVSFVTQTLAKTAKALPVLLWGTLIGRRKYRADQYINAILSTAGCSLFVLGGNIASAVATVHSRSKSSWWTYGTGMCLLLTYLAADGWTSTQQEHLFKSYGTSIREQLLYTTAFSTVYSLFASIAGRQLVPAVLFLIRHPSAAAAVLMLSAMSTIIQICISRVENDFSAADGIQLTDQLQIGKNIGSGSTADVYQLLLVPDGNQGGGGSGNASGMSKSAQSAPRKAGQVLKWAKPVPGLRQAFQREWMLGRRLNAAAQHDASLSILLQTGPAVVSCSPSGHEGHQQQHHQHHHDRLVFRGAVLEGINGQSLDKRLEEDSSFCDIDFILACLQKHGYDSAASAALAQGILSFKLLDWGHSTIHELDGRAWPERKRQKVLKFYDLIEDLLGLKLQARFFQDVAIGPDGQARRLGSSEVVYDEVQQGYVKLAEVPALDMTAKPRRFKLLRSLRDKVLRWWSRLFSRRPRVSAREVLHRMRHKDLLVLSE
eukprot:gene12014-12158_t